MRGRCRECSSHVRDMIPLLILIGSRAGACSRRKPEHSVIINGGGKPPPYLEETIWE